MRAGFNNVYLNIRSQCLIDDQINSDITVDRETVYNNMTEAMFTFKKKLFNPNHKSYYSPSDIQVLNNYRTIVPQGELFKGLDKFDVPKQEIDMNKAFTDAFNTITRIGVFNQFDNWKAYNSKCKIKDVNIYLVKAELTHRNLFFNNDTNAVYGMFLKHFMPLVASGELSITHYKQPHFIHKVDNKMLVEELWGKRISENIEEDKAIKKIIANSIFGLLEKSKNSSQRSFVFNDLNEAISLQADAGGKLNMMSRNTAKWVEEFDDNGMWCRDREVSEQNDNLYYILNVVDRCELSNGFHFIKEMLLQYHNFKMQCAYQKLTENNVKVLSVKCDAFVVDCSGFNKFGLRKTQQLLDFHDGIGGWKLAKTHDEIHHTGKQLYEQKKCEYVDIPIVKSKRVNIINEYDENRLVELVEKYRCLMIKAKFAGAGKSTICKNMERLKGYKVLFVVPTNNLGLECEVESVTVNKFFGIAVNDEKLDKYDHSMFDVIVFDEICFNNTFVLAKIKGFVEQHRANKIILATGDAKQLSPIKALTNTKKHEIYMNECIDSIFPHHLFLEECKRLKTQEDKDKLRSIYADIFEHELSLHDVINKYFKYTDDITGTESNVAYLNNTCREVSMQVRKRQGKQNEFEVGEIMICREYRKTKTYKINVNFRYEIINISDPWITIANIKTREEITLHIGILRSHFIFAFCYTCHSVQGCSIDDDVTIFGWNHHLITREWLWTGITRARDLNRVKFYKYSSDLHEEFNAKCIMNYFDRKVLAYKEQDRKNGFDIPKENYVDAEWLKDNVNGKCANCGCGFVLSMDSGNINSNLTCQRLCNDLPHTKDNVIAFCASCNRCFSDKITY